MSKTKKHKTEYYVKADLDEAVHKNATFAIGDRVHVLQIDSSEPSITGEITGFFHGNFGRGRVFARLKRDDGPSYWNHFPLGRLRKI